MHRCRWTVHWWRWYKVERRTPLLYSNAGSKSGWFSAHRPWSFVIIKHAIQSTRSTCSLWRRRHKQPLTCSNTSLAKAFWTRGFIRMAEYRFRKIHYSKRNSIAKNTPYNHLWNKVNANANRDHSLIEGDVPEVSESEYSWSVEKGIN